jgi:hypothetical protein
MLDAGSAVMAIDPFPERVIKPTTRKSPNPSYVGGFVLGYNRSVIAERAHDLLTAIRLARGTDGTKSVHLIAFGELGAPAVLARVLAGDFVDRAAIDLDQFDFDRVTRDDDPMLLPGAMKYGGIYAFASICRDRATLLHNARDCFTYVMAARTPGIRLEPGARDADSAVQWLLESGK